MISEIAWAELAGCSVPPRVVLIFPRSILRVHPKRPSCGRSPKVLGQRGGVRQGETFCPRYGSRAHCTSVANSVTARHLHSSDGYLDNGRIIENKIVRRCGVLAPQRKRVNSRRDEYHTLGQRWRLCVSLSCQLVYTWRDRGFWQESPNLLHRRPLGCVISFASALVTTRSSRVTPASAC